MGHVINFLTMVSPFVSVFAILFLIATIFIFCFFIFNRRLKRTLIYFSSISLVLFIFMGSKDLAFTYFLKSSLVSADQIQGNDDLVVERESLLEALKSISTFKGVSGSHPTQPYSFRLFLDGNYYEMEIARDSRNDNVFWVFYKGFPFGGEVGFIDVNQGSRLPDH